MPIQHDEFSSLELEYGLGIPKEDIEAQEEPCPEKTEDLIPWLRERFPETTPRTSDRLVLDACIARAGCIDLINYIEAALDAARTRE